MVSPEDLIFAFEQTLTVHPEFYNNYYETLYSASTVKFNPCFITSTNGARKRVANATENDMIHYLIENIKRVYNSGRYFLTEDIQQLRLPFEQRYQKLLEIMPYYNECVTFINTWCNNNINSIIDLKSNNQKLLRMSQIVENIISNKNVYDYVMNKGKGNVTLSNGQSLDLNEKIIHDMNLSINISEVKVNHKALNKCMIDVLNGSQLKYKHNTYKQGNLYASQDIGRKRNNQEDCVIILEHPQFKEYKLMAVSDGMGGTDFGELTSSFTIQQVTKWFNKLSIETLRNPMLIQQELNRLLNNISLSIYNQYNTEKLVTGATFTGSIITPNCTIISSIGDSRAYTVKDDELILETRDESRTWMKYLNVSPTKDDLDDDRFFTHNNEITRAIGQGPLGHIQTKIIPNTYDKLLIFSDGVTDLLRQDEIEFISSYNAPEKITELLVAQALNKNAIRQIGEDEFHNAVIPAGKDNATAAMYSRR